MCEANEVGKQHDFPPYLVGFEKLLKLPKKSRSSVSQSFYRTFTEQLVLVSLSFHFPCILYLIPIVSQMSAGTWYWPSLRG